MCATIGHNHPAIVEAVRLAGENAFHLFSGMIPEVVARLAATLARDWMPSGLSKSIFVNTGSESNEVALRMAKMHTQGYEILAVGGSWHGVTGGVSGVSSPATARATACTCPASTSCRNRTCIAPISRAWTPRLLPWPAWRSA